MKSLSPFPRRQFLKRLTVGTAALATLPRFAAGAVSPYSGFGPVGGLAPEEMIDTYQRRLAFAALDRRLATYESIKTPEDIAAYQKRLRAFFLQQIGGFPDQRTPLRSRVTGRLSADGYRIEKVIYESLPGYAVTANLYLPLTPPPYPGVLFSCGHSTNGKASEAYQRACALLARNGLAVLNYDPVGQGERRHYLDEAGQPRHGPTHEHNLLGLRCRLTGASLPRFMMWDGIRGIDYLQSRPDIIPDRIGATGNSGGGTLTSYLMALDDRIVCAAPSCYLTGYRRLLETIGPQDFEQNIFGQIEGGLDHADYLILRVPKPTLMCVATQDFFDIQGAWDTFRQAKRIYTRLGHPERVALVEADEKHGFSLRLREGAAQWMRRWLLGIDEPMREPDFSLPEEKDLLCTPEGQVLRGSGAVSLFQLLDEQEKGRRPRRPDAAAVRQAAGIRELSHLPKVEVERGGALSRQGRSGEKLALRYESGLWLPSFHFPAAGGNSTREVTLYFPDQGIQAGWANDEMTALLGAGGRLLAVDLPGIGETASNWRRPGASNPFGHDSRQAQMAFLLGQNLVALRAEAILLAARFLGAAGAIRLVAGKQAAIAALHAAAVEPALFSSVQWQLPVSSWGEFVRTPELALPFADAVPNALTVYDLPELLRMIPAGKLRT